MMIRVKEFRAFAGMCGPFLKRKEKQKIYGEELFQQIRLVD